jgi:hypothetical protein
MQLLIHSITRGISKTTIRPRNSEGTVAFRLRESASMRLPFLAIAPPRGAQQGNKNFPRSKPSPQSPPPALATVVARVPRWNVPAPEAFPNNEERRIFIQDRCRSRLHSWDR